MLIKLRDYTYLAASQVDGPEDEEEEQPDKGA